jgi:hypothetical protein
VLADVNGLAAATANFARVQHFFPFPVECLLICKVLVSKIDSNVKISENNYLARWPLSHFEACLIIQVRIKLKER